MKELSIIIPAYNEAETINPNLRELQRTLIKNNIVADIIVVDDGSADFTYHCISQDPKIVSCQLEKNMGKGEAIRQGFGYVKTPYTMFFDADLDIHPYHIPLMMTMLKVTGSDCVIGSKLHPSSMVSTSPMRKFLSWGYFILVKLLFGLKCRDTQTGIKLFKTEVLKKVMPKTRSRRFAFDLELLVNIYKENYKVREMCVEVSQKRKSRLHIGNVWNIFVETMVIWYRNQRR